MAYDLHIERTREHPIALSEWRAAIEATEERAFVESMRSGAVKYRTMRRSDVTVRTFGCLAGITGLFEQEIALRGEPLSEQVRFHSLWVKRGQGLARPSQTVVGGLLIFAVRIIAGVVVISSFQQTRASASS